MVVISRNFSYTPVQLFNVEIHFLEVNTSNFQTLLDQLDISLFASHEKIDKCGVICWNIT